jgi:SAM-dependent methyltransferase
MKKAVQHWWGTSAREREISLLRKFGRSCKIGALRLPFSAKLMWKRGITSETQFWDDWFRTKGSRWSADYNNRLDPDFPLQPRAKMLLPLEGEVHILDVGAGPLTVLGKKADDRVIKITAVDALANEYDKILRKYGVQPVIRTQQLKAEELTKQYSANTFDFCFARNCLDHAYSPEQAVLQMIEVVKRGRYVLLEHHPNEADNADYSGLHHWNFDVSSSGDFLIRSKFSITNMTKKYADLFTISCELLREGGDDWLITRILKN